MSGPELVWCDCQKERVPYDRCDGCDQEYGEWLDNSLNIYEDPPLYPKGKLEAMTLADLEREYDRQCNLQGRLGDAERIDDRAVETTEMRCRLVEAEIKRRQPAGAPGDQSGGGG